MQETRIGRARRTCRPEATTPIKSKEKLHSRARPGELGARAAQARPRAVVVESAGPTVAPEGAGPGVRRRFGRSGLCARVRTPPSTAGSGRRDAAKDRGQCPAGPATSARRAGPPPFLPRPPAGALSPIGCATLQQRLPPPPRRAVPGPL